MTFRVRLLTASDVSLLEAMLTMLATLSATLPATAPPAPAARILPAC